MQCFKEHRVTNIEWKWTQNKKNRPQDRNEPNILKWIWQIYGIFESSKERLKSDYAITQYIENQKTK